MVPGLKRPPLEVADILRVHGEAYRRVYQPSRRERKVLRHIEDCRTAALGGHKDTCSSCGAVRISYNSCRDRHCPKCQSLKKAEWLEARKARLLPVPYFHVVFTLPRELHRLVFQNKKLLFDMLFDAASRTLLAIARDDKHLGAQIGFSAVLHTWGQRLQFHPHLHTVVTGGGLGPDGQKWIARDAKFFLPVRVLGRLFRGKFLGGLKKARAEERLQLHGKLESLLDPKHWSLFLHGLYRHEWVVYSKPPFGGPEHVYRYLGRYTHRVAISNHRLVALADGKVTFHIKDYADGGQKKTLTLDALNFIRRFLLHVLPERYVRIRHYGLLAGANVKGKLERARELLGAEAPSRESETETARREPSWSERLFTLTGLDVFACPHCGGRMTRSLLDPRHSKGSSHPPAAHPVPDTS
jgi:predicted RNA-binding Zn-ribbon protein involved in translation (DUF1610 family)